MKTLCRNTARKLLISGIIVSLSGCIYNDPHPDNVRVGDHQAVSYDVKLGFQPADSRLGVVAESQAVSGQGDQYFAPKSYYDSELHSNQMRAETTTSNEFSLISNSIGLKWNVLISKHIGINMYFHAAEVKAKVDVEEVSGKEDQLKESNTGIAPQVEVYVPLNEKFRVVGSISNLINHKADFQTASLLLECAVNKNIAVNIGYKKWLYDLTAPENSHATNTPGELNFNDESDIRLRAEGVSIGATFSF